MIGCSCDQLPDSRDLVVAGIDEVDPHELLVLEVEDELVVRRIGQTRNPQRRPFAVGGFAGAHVRKLPTGPDVTGRYIQRLLRK